MIPEGPVAPDLAETPWNPDWLSSKSIQKLIKALGADAVRFVGGCVRDSLLGRPVSDIDLATIHKPEQTIELLEAEGIKVVPTGLAHGTITAVVDGDTFEVTTLRKDVSTDGRRATVAFTDSWHEDAARRDFTINALYASYSGEIYDPFGGLNGLDRREVRFIGDAEERIREDALRIYRFFRFSARFADKLDSEGLAACTKRAADVANLSRERVRDELLKLLKVLDPRPFLQKMNDLGLLPAISDETASLDAADARFSIEVKHGAPSLPETRLALLYPKIPAKRLATEFRLSKTQETLIHGVREASRQLADEEEFSTCLYQYGAEVTIEALKGVDSPHRADFEAQTRSWKHPEFPISGADLLAIGYAPGAALGQRLALLEGLWVASEFSMSKDELLKKAEQPN